MNDINLVLSRSDFYPPYRVDQWHGVYFTTTQDVQFRFLLNGTSVDIGGVPGIWHTASTTGGTLLFKPPFIANYSGNWPAQLEVQAHQNGQLVDSAMLLLHDTRTMVVSRAKTGLAINPFTVPVWEDHIAVQAVFFDPNGVELPAYELSWDALVQPVEGVTIRHRLITVTRDASPGSVNVVVKERSGVKAEEKLILLPRPTSA